MSMISRSISPLFPNELWLRVFEFATDVPGIFDTDIRDPFDFPTSLPPHIPYDRVALQSSWSTKRSLVLVCKRWYFLATRYLYAVVLVDNPVVLKTIWNTLRACQSLSDPTGFWTRRLILGGDLLQDSDPTIRSMTADVIRQLPKLTMFSVVDHLGANDKLLSDEVIEALITSAGSSLQQFYFQPDGALLTPSSWKALITGCPRLRIAFSNATAICPMDMLSAPELDLVCVGKHPCVARHQQSHTSAHQAYLAQHGYLSGLHDCLQSRRHFLALHGNHLTTIYLAFSPDSFYAMASSDVLLQTLKLLSECCPSVLHLILIIENLRFLPLYLAHPFLTHLGIYCNNPNEASDFYPIGALSRLESVNMPSLKVVRLLNPLSVANIQLLSLTSFRLEDHEGHELMPRVIQRNLHDVGIGRLSLAPNRF
ncbi:hypothetical protein EW146_g4438 [Bondarzewia mesenterica]|uniref:F-box domain-containing protein n=1 Tax=Bondarzewia mesenterica TaxID=1095465 RepID=A0A4S4LWF3_9AGAM|nr:hypothetical protein EW146_g4438 [Bondarzewia mesenterica]